MTPRYAAVENRDGATRACFRGTPHGTQFAEAAHVDHRSVAAVFVLVLFAGVSASAQTAPPMTFIGGAVARGSDDLADRITYPRLLDAPERRHVYVVDGAVKVSRRLALGSELVFLDPVASRSITRDGVSTQRHSERLWSALVRVRPITSRWMSVDVVGGPGLLSGRFEASFYNGVTTTATTTDTTSLAWTGGGDVSVSVIKGVGLVGTLRVYRLARGGPDSDLPFQSTTTRTMAGIGLRLGL
jgi:hypothetical protein